MIIFSGSRIRNYQLAIPETIHTPNNQNHTLNNIEIELFLQNTNEEKMTEQFSL